MSEFGARLKLQVTYSKLAYSNALFSFVTISIPMYNVKGNNATNTCKLLYLLNKQTNNCNHCLLANVHCEILRLLLARFHRLIVGYMTEFRYIVHLIYFWADLGSTYGHIQCRTSRGTLHTDCRNPQWRKGQGRNRRPKWRLVDFQELGSIYGRIYERFVWTLWIGFRKVFISQDKETYLVAAATILLNRLADRLALFLKGISASVIAWIRLPREFSSSS